MAARRPASLLRPSAVTCPVTGRAGRARLGSSGGSPSPGISWATVAPFATPSSPAGGARSTTDPAEATSPPATSVSTPRKPRPPSLRAVRPPRPRTPRPPHHVPPRKRQQQLVLPATSRHQGAYLQRGVQQGRMHPEPGHWRPLWQRHLGENLLAPPPRCPRPPEHWPVSKPRLRQRRVKPR